MESATTFAARGEVWLYAGDAGWHFVTLPPDVADELSARSAETARAFGSVPVRVTLGATSWTTCLFAAQVVLLPVAAQGRRAAARGSRPATP